MVQFFSTAGCWGQSGKHCTSHCTFSRAQ